jgi:hypothetical protein
MRSVPALSLRDWSLWMPGVTLIGLSIQKQFPGPDAAARGKWSRLVLVDLCGQRVIGGTTADGGFSTDIYT